MKHFEKQEAVLGFSKRWGYRAIFPSGAEKWPIDRIVEWIDAHGKWIDTKPPPTFEELALRGTPRL